MTGPGLVAEKPIVGRYIPEKVAEEIHAYLMTRPCVETLALVLALRTSKPLTREPK